HSGFGPRHAAADSECVRLDGDTELPRLRVAGDDRERVHGTKGHRRVRSGGQSQRSEQEEGERSGGETAHGSSFWRHINSGADSAWPSASLQEFPGSLNQKSSNPFSHQMAEIAQVAGQQMSRACGYGRPQDRSILLM